MPSATTYTIMALPYYQTSPTVQIHTNQRCKQSSFGITVQLIKPSGNIINLTYKLRLPLWNIRFITWSVDLSEANCLYNLNNITINGETYISRRYHKRNISLPININKQLGFIGIKNSIKVSPLMLITHYEVCRRHISGDPVLIVDPPWARDQQHRAGCAVHVRSPCPAFTQHVRTTSAPAVISTLKYAAPAWHWGFSPSAYRLHVVELPDLVCESQRRPPMTQLTLLLMKVCLEMLCLF